MYEYNGPDFATIVILIMTMVVMAGAVFCIIISENASNFDTWHRAFSAWWRTRKEVNGNRGQKAKPRS